MVLYSMRMDRRSKCPSRLAVTWALCLTILWCLSTHGMAAAASAASETDRPKIVAFGDSLTAGLGVAPEDSYPAELQRRLDAQGFRFRVINAGVIGVFCVAVDEPTQRNNSAHVV